MTPYISLCGCHGNEENANLTFPVIFQLLKCSYSLSVAGVLLKVVSNDGEDHKEHFDTKIDRIACFNGK